MQFYTPDVSDKKWQNTSRLVKFSNPKQWTQNYYYIYRVAEVFFPILYSHFKFFFEQSPQYYLTQRHWTLPDEVTILQVYIMTTSFNYFNFELSTSEKLHFVCTLHFVCDFGGQLRILQYACASGAVAMEKMPWVRFRA